MASGGFHSNKQTKSDSKRRSNWQRPVSTDKDDSQSLNSFPSDVRINNWDLSDLRPTNLSGDSKRRKKSKGNPEREREQSLSMDSPPQSEAKQHTPSSYPRTRLGPGASSSQRAALETLRQHMTFSDLEDVSNDGERNNERGMGRRGLPNPALNQTDPEIRRVHDRRVNRNNNMDYNPNWDQGADSNEIVARLMQIRDFMNQAKAMMESMEKLGDRKKTEDVQKVRRLMRNLQEQENAYRGLLQDSREQENMFRGLVQNSRRDDRTDDDINNDNDDDNDDDEDETFLEGEAAKDDSDASSVDLEVRTENSETSQDNSQGSRPRIESKLGLESEDEVEGATAAISATENSNTSRNVEQTENERFLLPGVPMEETDEGARGATAIDGVPDKPNAQHMELLRVLKEKQQQLQSLMNRQEELNLKRRETEKKLLDAQARDNKARAALAEVAVGKQVVQQEMAAQQVLARDMSLWLEDQNNEDQDGGGVGDSGDSGVLKSNIVGYEESDDEDNSNVREGETTGLSSQLMELKRQLNFLRNEFSMSGPTDKTSEQESQALADDRQQLQNKLQELQDKKSRMDRLLQELQRLHADQPSGASVRNNAPSLQFQGSLPEAAMTGMLAKPPLPPLPNLPATAGLPSLANLPANTGFPSLINVPTSEGLPANLQARMSEMAQSAPGAVESAMAAFARLAQEDGDSSQGNMTPEMVGEIQEKLRRLQEVRGQLDELRSLVQYYQNQKDEVEGRDTTNSAVTGEASAQADAKPPQRNTSHQAQGRTAPEQQLDLLLTQNRQQQQQLQKQEQQPPASSKGWSRGDRATTLQNMAQLLNLAGAEQGAEHSDEDNASVSQSDSQWSHLGPWDDDPEIQEKVKKLKAAKEKLRQLQDLVAFVQQAPVGDLSNVGEGEAVSQATQTDEQTISEGEMEPQEREEEAEQLEDPRAELERLRKERARLLELQSQLKQIHDVVGRPSDNQEEKSEDHQDLGKLEQAPNATVVTFASNDELYSKMRRQRILREELRSKKKELEAIMKKDRNKKQYSRNQDNQSDTVSLNTDTFGIPASVDATMATWGGSTVDNLENITEDGQERNERGDREEEEEEDDGYPSDGILQVEEEEEENDSDNGTYTIEADARQRKNQRKNPGMGIGARPKTSRGRQTFPQPGYTDRVSKAERKKRTKNQRSAQESRLRQENYRSAEEIIGEEDESDSRGGEKQDWFRVIESRLDTLSGSVEALLRKTEDGSTLPNQSSGLLNPVQEHLLQLQNQSLMLSFGQAVQALTRQQGDLQQLQQQMQMLQLQVQEYQAEHSFQTLPNLGSSMARPSLSTSALNSSNYNLQAAAQQQMASPYTQTNLNNTAPPGFFPSHSPGLRSFPQSLSQGLTASNLSLGAQDTLNINTGSNPSLPQQISTPGYRPGQTNILSLHQQPTAGSSSSTMTRDFSQFVNTALHTTGTGQFSDLFGSSSQQGVQASLDQLTNLSFGEDEDQRRQDTEEDPIMRGKRKSETRVKKSGSDSALVRGTSKTGNKKTSRPAQTNTGLSTGNSSYSSLQSIREQHSQLRATNSYADGESAEEGNTLFDNLRDTIYREVASLISQNESRPHYLLELFKDLRKMDSDYMRQRALYSMEELVNSNLSTPTPSWRKAKDTDPGNSELTPSESVTSEDEEEIQAEIEQQILAAKNKKLERGGRQGPLHNFPFDYVEVAEDPSSLSTPTNGLEESPFFQDGLGETVIELESLKQRAQSTARGKRTNEKSTSSTRQPRWGEGAVGFSATAQLLDDIKRRSDGSRLKEDDRDMVSSSAMDQASESSFSDVPYPRIDMKQLDGQIKAIMMQTIPAVKEHMESVCSAQLLAHLKRLVLSLTAQLGNQEFARFFQRQLASILQDTLDKYEGRRMRDCGEDLLVEISDVLFNELAFFRLMQDLDDPNVTGKLKDNEWNGRQISQEGSQYSADSSDDDDEDEDEDDGDDDDDNQSESKGKVKNNQKSLRVTESDQDEMGRERDDEMASKTVTQNDDDDKDDDESEQPYKIELAPSETKPFTRIGSDEDDDDGDEEQSMEDPSETAVSRDSMMEHSGARTSQRPEVEGSPDGEKQDREKGKDTLHQTNGLQEVANGLEEDGELTVDDLPERLTVEPANGSGSSIA